MIEHIIKTLTGDMSVQHLEAGTHLSGHCVKIAIAGKRIFLTPHGARELIDKISAELPTEFDPDGLKQFLIGKSASKYDSDWNALAEVVLQFGLTWEELHFVAKGSDEAEEAKSGDDECCLSIEYKNDIITDVIWG